MHVLYLLGPLPADSLAPPASAPRARLRSISAKMSQVQHRPARGAVPVDGLPEVDDLDLNQSQGGNYIGQ